MAATDLFVYATPISAYCCKLRLALALKGLDVAEVAPPGGYASAAYRAIVPQGTIPALVDGDFVLTESDAIIEYLDETGVGRPIIPQEPKARARVRAISRFIDTRLEPSARALFPLVGGVAPVPEAIRAAVVRNLAMLGQLAGQGPYLAGDAPGLPDCGFWAVHAVLDALDRALGLDLPPLTIAVTGGTPASCAPHIAAYRATLSDWMKQKGGGR